MNKANKGSGNIDVGKMLGYSAAALSVVSFFTTLNGIEGIVTHNTFFAILISFGIQSIILVMGLWFVPAVKTIWKKKRKQFLRPIVIVGMITAYICSVCFSSFFSFVHLSNAAYSGVRLTDYNMELEMFLVENTKEIKSVNDAISNVLVQNIREIAPKFRTLVDEYSAKANKEIQDVMAEREKNSNVTIPDTEKFSAQAAINAYEGANRQTADSRLVEDCERLQDDVNMYVNNYNQLYYQEYAKHFEKMVSQTDTSAVSARKNDVLVTMDKLKKAISLLDDFEYGAYDSINSYVKGRCNAISNYYNGLVGSLQEIVNFYDEISNNPEITQNEELGLENFYEAIYSTDTLTVDQLENAESELKDIISAYISNAETIDEDSVASLSQCIEYIEALNRSIELRDKIEKYENSNLSATYIVSTANSDGNNTSNIQKMDESAWNEARHEDISEFISLIKLLPDLSLVLSEKSERQSTNDANIDYLLEKGGTEYVSGILSKAYEYNRNKLEDISDMERAWNYLHSENSFLAIFCGLIALFLDIASFFIGLYMYACQSKKEKLPEKPSGEDEGT